MYRYHGHTSQTTIEVIFLEYVWVWRGDKLDQMPQYAYSNTHASMDV